jgi:hypothetical protein
MIGFEIHQHQLHWGIELVDHKHWQQTNVLQSQDYHIDNTM